MKRQKTAVLAGDIGGTKSNLAIYSSELIPGAPLAEASFRSRDFGSLEELVLEFLSRVGTKVDLASFGVAGPVVNGQAKTTNLPWVIDEASLADALGLPSVHLLNDLLAFAHAVPLLQPGDIHPLNEGQPQPGGAMAVVAPGTGLGEAFLTWDGMRYQAHPSEGGHGDFAPRNAMEIGLLLNLLNRFDHVSVERVCSGSGLVNIYTYLKETGYAEEPDWLAEKLSAVPDPAPVIVETALDGKRSCELCRETLDMFLSILGAEAGNAALRTMATGGVYLAGGIPPRILPALRRRPFMQAFRRKGRMWRFMDAIPVHVILNPKTALLGAACHGLTAAQNYGATGLWEKAEGDPPTWERSASTGVG